MRDGVAAPTDADISKSIAVLLEMAVENTDVLSKLGAATPSRREEPPPFGLGFIIAITL